MIYLLDISRLVENLHLETPTGIDRVEMAYAQHFLERDGDVRFVLTWPGFTGLLSREEARPLIEDAAERWSAKREPRQEAFDELCTLLHTTIPPHGASRVMSLGTHDDKRSHAAWMTLAKLWLKSRANGLSRARLAEFREAGAWYLHVSQFRLNRPRRFAWLAEAKARSLFMLHDLIPILYPEYCRPGEAARHSARLETMTASASVVVANSNFTRGTMERYLMAQGHVMPPTDVVPLGLSPIMTEAAIARGIDTDVPYFVVVGTIEPRKNLLFLLSVWHRWTQGGRRPRARLVIVGRRGWENENVVDLLDRSVGLAPSVIEVSSLGDAGMVSLLRGAAALIAPSFVEGYGLPVAEALALGVPVLASDIPAHREAGGDCADYIHPLDGLGWATAFDDYCDPHAPRRNAQRERLKSYQPMTWRRHMAEIEQILVRSAK